MWNSGMTSRQRSRGVKAKVPAMLRAEAVRLCWRSGTILGRDVVPEVWSTSATSSESGCGAPASANGIESVKPPAGPLSSGVNSITGMLRRAATARAGESGPPSMISTLAWRSSR
jgi:hypothetical protein